MTSITIFFLFALALVVVAKPRINGCTEKVYVGNGVDFAISEDAGETWAQRGHNIYPQSIYGVNEYIYVGTNNGIAITKNDGLSWTQTCPIIHTAPCHMFSVFGINARVWMIWLIESGPNGPPNSFYFSISDDNGETWPVNSTLPESNWWYSGLYAVGNKSFVGTSNNGLGMTTDNGTTWKYITTAQGLASDRVGAITGVGDTLYVAAGAGDLNAISISENNGNTWRIQKITTGSGFSGATSIAAVDDQVYVGTQGNGLFISKNGGDLWATKTTADGLLSNTIQSVAVVGSNIYVATDKGLSVSRDGGQTWATKDTGLLPPSSVFANCV